MTSTEITVFGIVCAAIGALINHLIRNRLAINRDKRREYNALVDPMRQTLLGMRNQPNINLTGSWEITFTLIREKLSCWQTKGFDRAVENYKKSKGAENRNPDGMSGFSYKDTTIIVHAINDLLKYLKPR